MTPPIRLVLAEDQRMMLSALSTLLELEDDIDVVATASDGRAALDAVLDNDPDVLLADIEMPGLTGIELAEELRRRQARTRVVIVTTFARPAYLRRAMDAQVAGYILKDSPLDELVETIRQVHDGARVIQPDLVLQAWESDDPLTDRERDVLRLAAEGHPSAAIAEALHLAEGTVRNYLSTAMSKLRARNRTEAAYIARERGLL